LLKNWRKAGKTGCKYTRKPAEPLPKANFSPENAMFFRLKSKAAFANTFRLFPLNLRKLKNGNSGQALLKYFRRKRKF